MQKRISLINSYNTEINNVDREINIWKIQISVLKIQINPYIRVGFSTVSLDPEGDRTKIIKKDSNAWPKHKVRNISNH